MKKLRADTLLVRQGFAKNKKMADAMIMSGKVFTVKEEKILTSGEQLKEDIELYIKGKKIPYVSRGGLKLKKAVDKYGLDLNNHIVLDIGSSTGGFTDVSLQEGAKLVYALDVGTNQLAWKIRNDKRVVVMEQTNFRHSTKEDFTHGSPDIAVIDVSFISLKIILNRLKNIIKKNGKVIALIKPQFEAPKDLVGEKGIIRDFSTHRLVLEETTKFITDEGFVIHGISASPIVGGKGNIEFLVYLEEDSSKINQKDITKMIDSALEESLELKE